MSNRQLLFATGVLGFCILFLFGLNFTRLSTYQPSSGKLELNTINGMAVKHNGLLYTLNLEQQSKTAEALSQAQTVEEGFLGTKQLKDISEIIIYLFNKKEITITPIEYNKEGNLIFFAPEWNEKSYLVEKSNGALKKLLANTYDP